MLCATVVKMLYVDLDDRIRVVDMTRASRILQSYGKIVPSKSAHRKLVGCFGVSHTVSASLSHMFSVYVKSRRAAVLKAKEKL